MQLKSSYHCSFIACALECESRHVRSVHSQEDMQLSCHVGICTLVSCCKRRGTRSPSLAECDGKRPSSRIMPSRRERMQGPCPCCAEASRGAQAAAGGSQAYKVTFKFKKFECFAPQTPCAPQALIAPAGGAQRPPQDDDSGASPWACATILGLAFAVLRRREPGLQRSRRSEVHFAAPRRSKIGAPALQRRRRIAGAVGGREGNALAAADRSSAPSPPPERRSAASFATAALRCMMHRNSSPQTEWRRSLALHMQRLASDTLSCILRVRSTRAVALVRRTRAHAALRGARFEVALGSCSSCCPKLLSWQ